MAHRKTYVRPDFEITVNNSDGEAVLVCGVFVEQDGTVDIGLGWDDRTDKDGLCALLDAVAVALQGASFTQFKGGEYALERAKIEGGIEGLSE